MEEGKKKGKNIKISIVISVALSLSIILLILYFTIDSNTINQIRNAKIRYEFFALAILLNIIYWCLWGARLKVISNTVDENVKISFFESTKIVIANLFLAGITPSMAGGEPVRIYLLNKDGHNLGSATGIVLGERLFDAIYILSILPIAIFIFKDVTDIGFLTAGLLIGVVFFIILLILFIYSIIKPEKTKSFLLYLNKKLQRFRKDKTKGNLVIERINSEVDNFSNSIKGFSGKNKKAFIKIIILTMLFWTAGFLIPSMILIGLGLPPFFIESYAAQVLLLVIIMMPTTPGSSGVAEIGVYGLYGAMIGTTSESLIGVFILLYRFISYHMNLIAGGIFQYKIFRSFSNISMDTIKKTDHTNKDEK